MRWTNAARYKRSKEILHWQPWCNSSGPKTLAGKRRLARNNFRGCVRPLLRIAKRAIKKKHRLDKTLISECAQIEGYKLMLPTQWAKLILQRAGFNLKKPSTLDGLELYQQYALTTDMESALQFFDLHVKYKPSEKKTLALQKVYGMSQQLVMGNVVRNMLEQSSLGNTSASQLLVLIQQNAVMDSGGEASQKAINIFLTSNERPEVYRQIEKDGEKIPESEQVELLRHKIKNE